MGTSVIMFLVHNSKVTATMTVDKLSSLDFKAIWLVSTAPNFIESLKHLRREMVNNIVLCCVSSDLNIGEC